MALARYFLLGIGLFTLAFGLAYLFSPAVLTDPAGFGALAKSAWTDVRATYGGFQIGMGVFLIWCAQSEERYRAALVLMALTIGAVFSSRMIGLILDGELNAFHQSGLAFEFALTASTLIVLRRLRT